MWRAIRCCLTRYEGLNRWGWLCSILVNLLGNNERWREGNYQWSVQAGVFVGSVTVLKLNFNLSALGEPRVASEADVEYCRESLYLWIWKNFKNHRLNCLMTPIQSTQTSVAIIRLWTSGIIILPRSFNLSSKRGANYFNDVVTCPHQTLLEVLSN